MYWRVTLVFVLLSLGMLLLIGKTFFNFKTNEKFKTRSEQTIQRHHIQRASRGVIYDSNGVILAIDVEYYSFILSMKNLSLNWQKTYQQYQEDGKKKESSQGYKDYLKTRRMRETVKDLSTILFVEYKAFNKKLLNALRNGKKSPIRVANDVVVKNYPKFRKLYENAKIETRRKHNKYQESQRKNLPNISQTRLDYYTSRAVFEFYKSLEVTKHYRRRYPHVNVFSNLIGFMKKTDTVKRTPLEGIEKSLNSTLQGKFGRLIYLKNNSNEIIQVLPQSTPVMKGKDVHLTIDSRMQHIVNKELYKNALKHRAKSASAMLVEVKTGAIKAIVSYPNFNPNNTNERSAYRTRFRPLVDRFEPGSVQKPLLAVAGLESGAFGESSTVKIFASNHFSWRSQPFLEDYYIGTRTLTDVIKYSINSGIIKFAERVKRKDFWHLYKKLNYAVDYNLLDGTMSVHNLAHFNSWSESEYYSRTYGYVEKINVRELISFYVAVANDGLLPAIYMLPKTPEQVKATITRVMTKKTALIMKKILHSVVQTGGTGKRARIKNIKVAGKTGTARKGIVEGHSKLKYRAVFVGFAPLEQPQYALAIVIDEPTSNEEYHGGSKVAAPVFSTIMQNILKLQNNHDSDVKIVEKRVANE